METKTRALAMMAFVLILFCVAIVFRIKLNRKRKSLAISSAERDKDFHIERHKPTDNKSDLWGFSSWGLALLTMFLAFIVLMVVGDIIAAIFKLQESNGVVLAFYILYNLIIAGGCFYICRQDPKSIWYVPVLCNLIGIISAIVEQNFWIGSLWIVIGSGWVLSIIASIIGALIGKKKAIPGDQ